MPQPRTTSDIERPLRDRERGIVLNRNRGFQRRITPGQAGVNAGVFARRARNATAVPQGRQPAQRAGLLSRARGAVRNLRAGVLNRRANRNIRRAARLRNG